MNELESPEHILQKNMSLWKPGKKCKILFRRDFISYTGGHQKVFDYYKHLIDLGCDVDIFFSKRSKWHYTNPWHKETQNIVSTYKPRNYDLLFIAGMDWKILAPGIENKIPVINLIQHVRHTNPMNKELYSFLKRKAIRIGVSNEVADALRSTGVTNGPIYAIPNGHNIPDINLKKVNDIYILGKKNPSLAIKLEKKFKDMGYQTICTTTSIPRDKVFNNMAISSMSVLLPMPKEAEGFFLPALEAMKYSDLTVVPDCVGNRSFCFDKINCLMPLYTQEDIVKKVKMGMEILKSEEQLSKYKSEALQTVNKCSIEVERASFYKVLNEIFKKKGNLNNTN